MSDEAAALAARMDELEMRFTYQERVIDELSQRIWQLQNSLDRLESSQRTMATRIQEIADGTSGPMAANVRPPHY